MPVYAADVREYFQHSRQFYHLITDGNARMKDANEFFIERMGERSRIIGSCMSTILVPEEHQKFSEFFLKLNSFTQPVFNPSFRYYTSNGGMIKICWEVSVIDVNDGTNRYLQWIGIEEHQSKVVFDEMGRTLQDIKERFRAYELSSEGIWRVDLARPVTIDQSPDGILEEFYEQALISDCNDNIARTFGYSSAEEVKGKPFRELVNLKESHILEFVGQLIENNFESANIETTEKDRNGNVIHLLNNITCILEQGTIVRVWGTVQDVTALKVVEQRLMQSEQFYRTLITDSLDGMLLTKEDGTISFVSPSVERILGYRPESLNGMNAFEFMHPEDKQGARLAFLRGQQDEFVYDFVNIRLLHKSGEWTWCMLRVHSLLTNPNVGRVIIYFSDNSERKRAEDALRTSEERFRTLLENLSVGVQLFDPNGQMILFNPAALEILGLQEEDVLGKQAVVEYDIVREDGTPFSPQEYPIAVSLREKIPVKNVVMGVWRPALNDRVWILLNSTPVLDSGGVMQYVIASYLNITEHRRLSQQLNEQELTRQKQLLQVTIDAQERERREIGRELHDNISQHLTITRLHLEVARELARGELGEAINLAHKSLLGIVNEIRKLSHSLVPPSLNDIGLAASIQDMCDGLRGSFTIEFIYEGFNEDVLPENMRLTIYRIIQEQINNIIRHSNASRIFISLQTIDDSILLFIEDDGRGFNVNKVKKGLGFTNMSNRAGLFGGRVKIDSSEGKGCLVEIEIPIPSE